MTAILCRWLNEDVHLSQPTDPDSFAKEFANGFLFGELLSRYSLQSDFGSFSRQSTSEAKLNNFLRLEPTLRQLGIPFDANTAHDIMAEKAGAAGRLAYKLYSVIGKQKAGTATAALQQEPRKPSFRTAEQQLFESTLKRLTQRQADIDFQGVEERFRQKQRQQEAAALRVQQAEEARAEQARKAKCQQLSERTREVKRQAEERLKAFGDVPKGATTTKPRKVSNNGHVEDIEVPPRELSSIAPVPPVHANTAAADAFHSSHFEEINDRKEREKRRRRVLMKELELLESLDASEREAVYVSSLARQAQEERRIASMLLDARREKQVIVENRMFRMQQEEQRRQRDFEEALNRERAAAQRAKEDFAKLVEEEQTRCRKDQEDRDALRAEFNHKVCLDVVLSLVDFSAHCGLYRQLTNKEVPAAMLRDWKTLLLAGWPATEAAVGHDLETHAEPTGPELLDDLAFRDYSTVQGEWAGLVEDSGPACAPNIVLDQVLERVCNIAYPPRPATDRTPVPPSRLRVACVGKMFCGKSSVIRQVAAQLGLAVISVDEVVQEAVEAYDKEKNSKKKAPLSARAVQGREAMEQLAAGKAVPDTVVAELVALAVRSLQGKEGFIVDGFPTTVAQAKLLQYMLTGAPEAPPPPRLAATVPVSPGSLLLAQSKRKETQPPPRGLDMVVLFDVPDKIALQRAFAMEHDLTDPDVIRARLQAWHGEQEALVGWYAARFDNVKKIDATDQASYVSGRLAALLLELGAAKDAAEAERKASHLSSRPSSQGPGSAKGSRPPSGRPGSGGPVEHVSDAPADAPATAATPSTPSLSAAAADAGAAGGSASHPSTPAVKRKPSHAPGKKEAGKEHKEDAAAATTPAAPATIAPAPQLEVTAPTPDISKMASSKSLVVKVKPGDPAYVVVARPLDTMLAQYLAPLWDSVEDTYVRALKVSFCQLRCEQDRTIHFTHTTAEEFAAFLKRPDHKQEFVSRWQDDFNNMPDDMRSDDDTKAELFNRLEDLKERLWDITDTRRAEADNEKKAIVAEMWLEDHLGTLCNLFFTLIQAEIDRHFDAHRLIDDYYAGLFQQPLSEPGTRGTQIPLLDMSLPPQDESAVAAEAQAKVKGGKKADAKEQHSEEEEGKWPMLRRPATDEGYATLLENACAAALATIKPRESPEAKRHRLLEEQKAQAAAAQAAAAKAAKKKGSKSTVPEPEVVVAAPTRRDEEAERLEEERYAAAVAEDARLRARVELLRRAAVRTVEDVRKKIRGLYSDMDEWIGACYQNEMKSVEQLCTAAAVAIEGEKKLYNEFRLDVSGFIIDLSVYVLEPPPPPPPPVVKEALSARSFTVQQVDGLFRQFLMIAPHGCVSVKRCVDLLRTYATNTIDAVPEAWRSVSAAQLQVFCRKLAPRGDYVDWRAMLISLLQIPNATLQVLLDTQARYQGLPTPRPGFISLQQYQAVRLWFEWDECPELEFNRPAAIKQLLFDMLCAPLTAKEGEDAAALGPPDAKFVNYNDLLLYLCEHPTPLEGLRRAAMLLLPPEEHDGVDLHIGIDVLYELLHHGRYNPDGAEDSPTREDLTRVFGQLSLFSDDKASFALLFQYGMASQWLRALGTRLYNVVDPSIVFAAPS